MSLNPSSGNIAKFRDKGSIFLKVSGVASHRSVVSLQLIIDIQASIIVRTCFTCWIVFNAVCELWRRGDVRVQVAEVSLGFQYETKLELKSALET